MPSLKNLRTLLLLLPTALLAGCNTVLLNPSGDVAAQQGKLIIVSTVLMLLIIIPVIALTLLFAWRYRQSNKEATYSPEWDHSTALELVIWAAPLLIIIALGAITWISTHTLDPYRPLRRIDENRLVSKEVRPLVVQVVALDWKWLFFYPEQGIAVLNEMAAPVDRPIQFQITASNVMNAFYVPELAGMIYAMPGMQTKLHAVINKPGNFEGFSANYSGAGFSHMRFRFHALDNEGFEKWTQKVHDNGKALSREAYLRLEEPSEKEPVRYYNAVTAGLYDAIVDRCVDTKKMCMSQMMAIDANGGMGMQGIDGLSSKAPAREDAPDRVFVAAQLCTVNDPTGETTLIEDRRPRPQ
jgi:cytochrome o ubiquinol oxidase subunit 2